jgi:uncharacterized delta-60 repeat protein
MNSKFNSIVLAIGLFFAFSASFSAAPGDLDPTFSGDGKLTDWSGWAYEIAIQPDGKIVAAGLNPPFSWGFPTPNHNFLVARYNSDGSPDGTFGGGTGRVVIDSGSPDYVTGIAIQGDGKILLTGRFSNLGQVIVRLNANGSRDTTFGSNGVVRITNCAPGLPAIQPDGKIVVSHFYVGVCRYNPDGSPDTSFGVGGFVTTNISEQPYEYQYAFSMMLQPDGKIVLAGGIDQEDSNPPRHTVLIRYNQNGSLDTSFGGTGIVRTRPTDDFGLPRKVLLQPDGKIVAAGELYIVRYNTDGSLDSTFGSGGIASNPPFPYGLSDAALQTDGKILVSGTAGIPYTNWDFALARYNTNGSLDTTFGGVDGIITFDFNNSNDIASAITLDSQGRAVVAGRSEEAFAIARFLLQSNPPFDFDGDGRSDISVFRPSDRTWYLNQSQAGFSAAQFGLSTDKPTPADYDGDGKTDISVYRDGTWYWLNSSNNSFNARQFGLPDDIPVPANYITDGDGRSELAVYRSGTWWILNLANNQVRTIQFGLTTDKPVVGDYDGDGRADFAVYRNGVWYLLRSTQGFGAVQFGLPTDKLVPADYDGDGKTDAAVYRNGIWYQFRSSQGFTAFQFGVSTDIPAPADYDGDGRADAAVYRDGVWYLLQSSNGFANQRFGLPNDKPVPAAFLP